MRRRIVPVVLFAACIGAFVASGLHSGAQGLHLPASVTEPQTRTVVYCVDTTVGSDGKSSKHKCVTEPRTNANGKLYITLRPPTTP